MEFQSMSQLQHSGASQETSFASAPISQPQQQQSASQPQQQQRNMTAQMMYQNGQFSMAGAAAAQGQAVNVMNRQANHHQPYSTWSAMGGNVTKPFPIQRRSTMGSDGRSRPVSMTPQTLRHLGIQPQRLQTEFLQQNAALDSGAWARKGFQDLDFTSLENEMGDLSQGLMTTDEEGPIIDLRQLGNIPTENGQDGIDGDSRRLSESSFSMSSNGLLAEVPNFEDLSTSDMSYPSESEWSAIEPSSSSNFSPIDSPHPQHDLVRSGSRSRASPSSHNNMRTSPYSIDTNRNKRWSTGMYGPSSAPSRPMHHFNRYSSFYGSSPLNPHNGLASFTNDPTTTTFASPNQPLLYTQHLHGIHGNNSPATLFSSPDSAFPEAPRQLPSQSLFRLLPSHADRLNGVGSHFADLSDPPDLYASLHNEPSNPPESDMNPSDPDLVPHEQDLRFPGDLYTPRWVRGHGNKREGWCGLCKPGRWLVLKNSAFWYDKSFTHGVSAATGAAFQAPTVTRRTEGNADVWEGLCGGCGDWVSLVSSKKKGTTWFRHAYKCHTHPKVKDGPKRRRETTSSVRPRGTSVSSMTYSTAPSNLFTANTSNSNANHATVTPTNIATTSATPGASGSSPVSSTKTTIEVGLAESLVKTADDYDTEPPLTATRITMDIGDPPKSHFIKAENSDDVTPISTPQLSNTTLSTPPMGTPGGMSSGLGLGVQGLGMDMGMGLGLDGGFHSLGSQHSEHDNEITDIPEQPEDGDLMNGLSNSMDQNLNGGLVGLGNGSALETFVGMI